jgi:serine/threonine protein kinase
MHQQMTLKNFGDIQLNNRDDLLGKGSYGRVYRYKCTCELNGVKREKVSAKYASTKTAVQAQVAVKKFTCDVKLADNEVGWLAAFKHPNIIGILGVARNYGVPCMVFEYANGSLASLIHRAYSICLTFLATFMQRVLVSQSGHTQPTTRYRG